VENRKKSSFCPILKNETQIASLLCPEEGCVQSDRIRDFAYVPGAKTDENGTSDMRISAVFRPSQPVEVA
jgi:hypothetical protein